MNRTLPERIFVCGFMGAGKSTAGRALARKLNCPFLDLDSYIENRAEKSISAIFEAEGEPGFRKQEKTALLDIIRTQKGVIALGGGTLHNQYVVDHIKVNGLLIFIDTPMPTMLKRIKNTPHRPLLLDGNGQMKPEKILAEELEDLYSQRFPFYEQAEITINPDKYSSPGELAEQMEKKIKYHVAIH